MCLACLTAFFEALIKEKIDGEAFFELDEDCLKEITPCLGDCLELKKAIRGLRKIEGMFIKKLLYLELENGS